MCVEKTSEHNYKINHNLELAKSLVADSTVDQSKVDA
jgi:hypothetical protein